MHYRKIWENTYGEIPIDENGFSYEIHHADGNHKNNNIENLQLVTIREHFDIHLQQEDWFAAALIAKRIGFGPDYSSSLQKGKKRPNIGGVPKGTVPWNKGKKYSFSEEIRNNRKGKRFGKVKITDHECYLILEKYNNKIPLNGVGDISKNGRKITYERVFSKEFHKEYNVTESQLYNIITGKRNVL